MSIVLIGGIVSGVLVIPYLLIQCKSKKPPPPVKPGMERVLPGSTPPTKRRGPDAHLPLRGNYEKQDCTNLFVRPPLSKEKQVEKKKEGTTPEKDDEKAPKKDLEEKKEGPKEEPDNANNKKQEKSAVPSKENAKKTEKNEEKKDEEKKDEEKKEEEKKEDEKKDDEKKEEEKKDKGKKEEEKKEDGEPKSGVGKDKEKSEKEDDGKEKSGGEIAKSNNKDVGDDDTLRGTKSIGK